MDERTAVFMAPCIGKPENEYVSMALLSTAIGELASNIGMNGRIDVLLIKFQRIGRKKKNKLIDGEILGVHDGLTIIR